VVIEDLLVNGECLIKISLDDFGLIVSEGLGFLERALILYYDLINQIMSENIKYSHN